MCVWVRKTSSLIHENHLNPASADLWRLTSWWVSIGGYTSWCCSLLFGHQVEREGGARQRGGRRWNGGGPARGRAWSQLSVLTLSRALIGLWMHLRHLSQGGSLLGWLKRLQPHPSADDSTLPGSDGRHHGEQTRGAAEDGGTILAAAATGQSESLGISKCALPGSHYLHWDVRRVGRLAGAAGRRRSRQDGRGVPWRKLEGQAEPL